MQQFIFLIMHSVVFVDEVEACFRKLGADFCDLCCVACFQLNAQVAAVFFCVKAQSSMPVFSIMSCSLKLSLSKLTLQWP